MFGFGRSWGKRLAFAVTALLLVAPGAKSEIVANLGTLDVGQSGGVICSPDCFGSGTVSGSLPAIGVGFSHQIHFAVSSEASVIGGTLLTPSGSITVTSIELYQYDSGATTPPGANATGTFLAAAVLTASNGTDKWDFTYSPLSPIPTSYFVQIVGTSADGRNYSQSVAISAVPLPPAVFLLAAALAGFVGFARFGRKAVKV